MLYTIRRDLHAHAVRADRLSLSLNLEIIDSDIGAFHRAMAGKDLRGAADLYFGPLLDGFYLGGGRGFEQWVDIERAHLANTAATAMESLARSAASKGDGSEAAAWWRRGGAIFMTDRRAATELVRALVAGGDRDGALQHARVYESLVSEELPVPEISELLAPDRRVDLAPDEEYYRALSTMPPTRTSPRRHMD